MAPTRAKLIATFIPANSDGNAPNSRINAISRSHPARLMRDSASTSGSTVRRPSTVSTTIENSANSTATAIFGAMPSPIQITNSGASKRGAGIGRWC